MDALPRASASLNSGERDAVDLAGDGTRMNLAQLGTGQVDWLLKQMLQAMASATPSFFFLPQTLLVLECYSVSLLALPVY